MTTIYFWVPDVSHATGGVRVAYRVVDACNAAGVEAAIMHQRPGFRARWFPNETRVVSAAQVPVLWNDVLVVSEFDAARLLQSTSGVTKVVFNQNHFWTFTNGQVDYRNPDVASVVTVSDDGVNYLEYAFPGLSCLRVHCGIDTDLFVPGSRQRKKDIAFLSYKGATARSQVLSMLKSRILPRDWDLRPLSGLRQDQLADILGETAIFAAFSEAEGCQLVLTEAMAAGCAVVGYPAGGGKEYLTEDLAWPVKVGDVISFARRLESVMTAWDAKRDEVDRKTRQARQFVRDTYPLSKEAADMQAALEPALEQARRLPSEPAYNVASQQRLSREAARRLRVAGKALLGK
jgi:glycosyltransferase involved in cell wall biosynthesis